MSIVSKITFYPRMALRYLYELLIKSLKFLINFLTNIGLMIIGVLITVSILSYNKFDPSLIGGLIIQVGSLMIDTSIKSKLKQLENKMIEA